MNAKGILSSVAAYAYNHFVTSIPSRHLRRLVCHAYLRHVGHSCNIQMGVQFYHAPRIRLGNRVVLNRGTVIDGRHHNVTIEDDVSIGPQAALLTLGHDPQSSTFENTGGEIRIGRRAWIAYGAIILPGVSIGEGAVVAAGAVVTKDVEPFDIVAGVPARSVGKRNRELVYELNYNPWLK